ncbi:MAG: hypothetical protein EAX90_13865 [Candidatus Heimdallarchaeota archaeon]|nr:hypothetical protein [Candidatus Heimdallarchaeota archaeon]
MRIKTSYILIIAILVLTPVLSMAKTEISDNTTFESTNWDSEVGVVGGETIYYDVDQLVFPTDAVPDNFTLPTDFTGIQLFCKVGAVETNVHFYEDEDEDIWGTVLTYGLGLKLTEDLVFGFDITELPNLVEVTLPEGSATPAVFMQGVPHFNTTFYGPAFFALNYDWSEHEVNMENMGFTVTNGEDDFVASMTNGSGVLSGTWRKSDGILTHLIFDDIYITDFINMTDITIEISFSEMEMKALDIYPGMVVNLNAADLEYLISTTGNFSDIIDQDFLDEIDTYKDAMLDQTVLRIIVDDVMGTFYKCSIYVWNPETRALYRIEGQMVFNGFFANIPTFSSGEATPLVYDDYIEIGIPGVGPFITPDWDIYEGQSVLMGTILGVFLEDVLADFLPSTEDYIQHDADASFGLVKRGNLYYYEIEASVEHEFNQTSSPMAFAIGSVANTYTEGFYQNASANAWIAYSKTGILAGFGAEGHIIHEQYGDDGYGDLMQGTVDLTFNIRVVNPEYNPLPPDEAGGGFIPGFTWLIAIPAILGVTTLAYLSRKKK